MKRVLVTGAAGFIGSHLCEFLASKGLKVVGLDNEVIGSISNLVKCIDSIEYVKGDILDPACLIQLGHDFDCVFHLAGLSDIVPSLVNPADYTNVNVQGTARVLEFVRKSRGKRIIYAASSSCYGDAPKLPTSEQDKLDPKYPYALSKMMGEELVEHWKNLYSIEAYSLRLFNVYGPRVSADKGYGAMFGVFMAQTAQNQNLTVIGTGNQKRDFTFVTDVCEAFYLASEAEQKDDWILNVGTGKPTSVIEVARRLSNKISYLPERPGEPSTTQADVTLINTVLGWEATTTITEGIEKMLDDIDFWALHKVWNITEINQKTSDWFKYLGDGHE